MGTDERLRNTLGPSDSVVVKVNFRPDEPEASASMDDIGAWSGRAIALGVVALIVMVIVLLLIVQGALDQAPR